MTLSQSSVHFSAAFPTCVHRISSLPLVLTSQGSPKSRPPINAPDQSRVSRGAGQRREEKGSKRQHTELQHERPSALQMQRDAEYCRRAPHARCLGKEVRPSLNGCLRLEADVAASGVARPEKARPDEDRGSEWICGRAYNAEMADESFFTIANRIVC